MAKRTFACRTFAARTFDSGTWQGVAEGGAASPSGRSKGIEYHFPQEKPKLRSKPRQPRVTSIVAYAKIGFRLRASYAFRPAPVIPVVQPDIFAEAVREPNRYTAGGRLRFGLRLRAESEFIRHVRLRATVDFYSHTEFLRELDEAELLEGVYD